MESSCDHVISAHSQVRSAGSGLCYHFMQVNMGDVIKQSCGCNQFATDTLVIDDEGVYDPGQYNDRLLLGFKGTMSEAELHWLHCRLVGGKLEKAQQGALRFRLPVGLVYDGAGQIALDPDE